MMEAESPTTAAGQPRKEKEKKTVYVRTRTYRSGLNFYDWYMLNLEDEDSNAKSSDWESKSESKLKIRPALDTMPSGTPACSAAVALGSSIYVLGGACRPRPVWADQRRTSQLPDVFYFDTLRPDRGWRAAPSLLSPRFAPSALAVDGNLYVFGGLSRLDACPTFAEVFDPNRNCWEPLPKPPISDSLHVSACACVHAVVSDSDGRNKRILVHFFSLNSLYAYFLNDKSWACVNQDFGEQPFSHSAVVDDVLYCLYEHDESLNAYDLVSNQWLPVESDIVVPSWNAVLLHLGDGELCLAVGASYRSGSHKMLVHFLKFTVEKRTVGEASEPASVVVVATKVSFDSFIVDGHDCENFLTL